MWQQARARLRNTDARLCVLVDCPSAGAWAQSLLAVPAAAAFASGIAVQASCRAGEMAWSQDSGGEAGGVFTSWYTRAEGHGQSPWSLAEAGGGGAGGGLCHVTGRCRAWRASSTTSPPDVLSCALVARCVPVGVLLGPVRDVCVCLLVHTGSLLASVASHPFPAVSSLFTPRPRALPSVHADARVRRVVFRTMYPTSLSSARVGFTLSAKVHRPVQPG